MIVSTAGTRPFNLVDRVGVAIRCFPNGQRHSAFLYRKEGEPPMLVHLGWHHDLRREPPTHSYLWANFAELALEERRFLASYLSTLGVTDPDIPYGLNSEGISFDPLTGGLQPHPDGRGVTCATFILSILKVLGHTVISSDGWPLRDDDEIWQTQIVEALTNDFPHHAEAVRQDMPCMRFRPEEVVGASATGDWPHGFFDAEAAGQEVLADLHSAFPVPPTVS